MPDRASFSNCMDARASRETGGMRGGKACSTSSCIIRMACTPAKGGKDCSGSGYDAKFRNIRSGTEIRISQAGRKVSSYTMCGTCTLMDYESGPIRGASIRSAGSAILLEVPR